MCSDAHPLCAKFEQVCGAETRCIVEPACQREKCSSQVAIAQCRKRDIDIGSIAVIETEPHVRAVDYQVENAREDSFIDPVPRFAGLAFPCADAHSVEAEVYHHE